MRLTLLLPVALLAACSRGEAPADGNVAEPSVANETVVSNQAPIAPTENATAVENVVAPAPSPAATEAARDTAPGPIPVAFRGRWGINAADCDPKRDDNKGLMTISAGSLKFYESLAKPKSVTSSSPTEIEARLDWSGEGQTWQTTTRLTLADSGKTLTRTSTDEGTLRYSRCAA